jgi:outer membrane murein-binding lipoprotein Lpp
MAATSRGPTTRSLDERIDDLSGDVKDLARRVGDFDNDLKWLKRIGAFIAAMLVAAGAGSGRVIWDAATISADVKQQGRTLDAMASDVKHQGDRLEKVEKRLDAFTEKVDAKLDLILRRGEPKAKGE